MGYDKEKLRNSLLLYAVTDRMWLSGRSLSDCVRKAIDGGVTFVQLREKSLKGDELYGLAQEVQDVCKKARIPFVINDDIGLALQLQTDGVHVGQDDMDCKKARKMLGSDKILGVSVSTYEEALLAQNDGADYLGVGAMYETDTKPNAVLVEKKELQAICEAVSIPVVAIGGITQKNIKELLGSGIAGVSVVSALFAAKDIGHAAKDLRAVLGNNMQGELSGGITT